MLQITMLILFSVCVLRFRDLCIEQEPEGKTKSKQGEIKLNSEVANAFSPFRSIYA